MTTSPKREKSLRSPASRMRSQYRTTARTGSTRPPTGESMLRVAAEEVWAGCGEAAGAVEELTVVFCGLLWVF